MTVDIRTLMMKEKTVFLLKRHKRNAGFTLVEMAIVLILSGLVMGMGAEFFRLYMAQKKHTDTIENMRTVQAGLYEFFLLNGRYPCPADPSLGPGDPNYGLEQCRDNTQPGCAVILPNGNPGAVTCLNDFSRDADGDGTKDYVMIGALPVITMTDDAAGATPIQQTDFKAKDAFDGWGMKLTYAVSEHMANPGENGVFTPANANLGAIDLIDENSIELTDPPTSAQYVLVSHGENMKGAYAASGIRDPRCTVNAVTPPPAPQQVPPNPGPLAAGNPPEIENCDYIDAIFVKGIMQLNQGPNYFDDIVFFKPSGRDQLWSRLPGNTPTQTFLKNNNLGDVGIGVSDPSSLLQVGGDMSAEKAVYGQKYCATDGSNCLNPEDIAGPVGSHCPDGEVAYGLHDENNDDHVVLVCKAAFDHLPLPSTNCASDEVMQGLKYDGVTGNVTPICVPKP